MAHEKAQPGDRYWQLLEPVRGWISIYEEPAVFLQQFRAVPPEVGHLFAAHWCQAEVRNGGFLQLFRNPTGVLAPEAVEGFKAIGLKGCAAVVEQAMGVFQPSYPRAQDVRQVKLKVLRQEQPGGRDLFSGLDSRFFRLLSDGRFARAADRYARQVGA